jgi:hypothetical protein
MKATRCWHRFMNAPIDPSGYPDMRQASEQAGMTAGDRIVLRVLAVSVVIGAVLCWYTIRGGL